MDVELYNRELEHIYTRFPMYQQAGRVAYKPGLDGMRALDNHISNPHRNFPTVHVAGTNGKGSVSHMIASALQSCGLRTGLYTSPHLTDFRERVKIDGEMVTKEFVYEFLTSNKEFFESENPSFFEITTALAFEWFSKQEVDVAVIETGLGGRLDSTNIISPLLSVITNIGMDHCEHLGYTLGEIAREKAGIIKPDTPVVIGEADAAIRNIFKIKADECSSRIIFAEDYLYKDVKAEEFGLDLKGIYQDQNIRTVLTALAVLGEINAFRSLFDTAGCDSPGKNATRCWNDRNIRRGLRCAAKNTGLRGRWEVLGEDPFIVCDTGHNAHGLKYVFAQLEREVSKREGTRLFIIIGFVAEKDLGPVLGLMPQQAYYLFTKAQISRALDAELLAKQCLAVGLEGEVKESVAEALEYFRDICTPSDTLFIGGSTFVVAEALTYIENHPGFPGK